MNLNDRIKFLKNKFTVTDVMDYFGIDYDSKLMKCPFHEETVGSFSITGDRKFFKCFGCGKKGDLINFVMLYKKFDFKTAIAFLESVFKVEESKKGFSEIDSKRIKVKLNKLEIKDDYFIGSMDSKFTAVIYKLLSSIDAKSRGGFLKIFDYVFSVWDAQIFKCANNDYSVKECKQVFNDLIWLVKETVK